VGGDEGVFEGEEFVTVGKGFGVGDAVRQWSVQGRKEGGREREGTHSREAPPIESAPGLPVFGAVLFSASMRTLVSTVSPRPQLT
jgi:hypothetical protein